MKRKVIAIMSTCLVVLSAVSAHATASAPAGMTDALETTQGTILAALSAVAPIALAIMGAFLAWRYGIRFFKSLAK